MIDNHIEDPEEGNVKFSSELDMSFNESDQELWYLGYKKHAFIWLSVTTWAVMEICQTRGVKHVKKVLSDWFGLSSQRDTKPLVLFVSIMKLCWPCTES